MNLVELQTFIAIVETGSLVRASERMNVTQSTVTARLKSLESELGQALINRQKSGASLTAAGTRLHRYASTISELWSQARQETALPDILSSVCNIGCDPDLWCNLGERLFNHIRIHIPQVAISVWQGNQSDLKNWLDDGLIDIAIGYSPNANQKQDIVPLKEDRLVLVSTDKNSPIRFDPNYIFVEAGEEFGREHASAYSDAGTARISFGSAQLGLEHLLNHGGTAYLPERMVKSHLEEEKLHLLREAPIFKRRPYLILNSAAREAWPWFEESLKSLHS